MLFIVFVCELGQYSTVFRICVRRVVIFILSGILYICVGIKWFCSQLFPSQWQVCRHDDYEDDIA